MTISLVVPAYNEAAFIGPCLDSVIAHTHGKLQQILVVDNASTDNTAEIARQRSGVTVIREDRKGTGHARQTGLEHATGDVVVYIDADTQVPEGWIEQIEKAFADPAVVLLSGPYRYYDIVWYKRYILNSLWWISAPATSAAVGFMALGGNMAMRRAVLQSVGFDRTIAFYGDDTDIARRMHKAGKTLWRMGFYINTSARRFRQVGIVRTNALYVANYLWPVIFHRPYTLGNDDIKRA